MATGNSSFNKANEYREQSRYSEAIESYLEALRLFIKDNNEEAVLDCFLSLGDTFRAKGEYLRARLLERGISIYSKSL